MDRIAMHALLALLHEHGGNGRDDHHDYRHNRTATLIVVTSASSTKIIAH